MNNLSSHHIVASSLSANKMTLFQFDPNDYTSMNGEPLVINHNSGISEEVKNKCRNSRIQINDNMEKAVSSYKTYEDRDQLPGYIDSANNTRMVINTNIDEVSSIIKEIVKNNGWCPSKPSSTSKDALRPDTRCPCPDFMIYGKCECGLFVQSPLVPDKDKLPTKEYSDFIDWDGFKKEEN